LPIFIKPVVLQSSGFFCALNLRRAREKGIKES